MGSILDRVDVREAGAILIVTGGDEATVNAVMDELRKDGARNATAATKVGSRWMATFEHPLLKDCRAVKEGFRITITGPNQDMVLLYSEQFRGRGAVVEAGPVQVGAQWALYLHDR